MRALANLGELAGATVLVRADLNVPLQDGAITDDGRVRAAAATIQELRAAGAKVVVISHLGRPKGQVVPEMSLAPVAIRLGEVLKTEVLFVPAVTGAAVTTAANQLQNGDVLLLENLRFVAAETSKDAAVRLDFAKELSDAVGASAFVLDGFGVVHRRQASVTELAEILPSAAGLLVANEVAVLERLIAATQRPYTVVLGGSKVSDKLGVIDHLLERVDALLIGGGMVFTFLAAKGYAVGASLLETEQLETVKGYLARAAELGVEIVLPQDIVVASHFAADAPSEVVSAAEITTSSFGEKAMGLDIGPQAAADFAAKIKSSQTVFWNGPMGVFEMPAFAAGTKAVAQALTECPGLTVVGGGDSAAAVRALGFSDSDFGHISTGGGASLEFLEGKQLPGLERLK